jgi:anti-sigma B factor antagonist
MFSLVENDKREKLLLNFSTVDFLGSAALGKLITLDRKVKAQGGALKLSNIGPNIYEVFAITKLNRFFDIKEDEADALAAF